MKRRQTIGVAVGFAIVVAFFVARLVRAGAGWGDLLEFVRALGDVGLLLCMIAPIPLAMFALGHLLWREVWLRSVCKVHESQVAAIAWSRAVGVSVLSVFLALTMAGITRMWTPGWMITGTMGIWSGPYHMNFTIGGAIFLAVGCGLDPVFCNFVDWISPVEAVWPGLS
jgi:hypothetical protein